MTIIHHLIIIDVLMTIFVICHYQRQSRIFRNTTTRIKFKHFERHNIQSDPLGFIIIILFSGICSIISILLSFDLFTSL